MVSSFYRFIFSIVLSVVTILYNVIQHYVIKFVSDLRQIGGFLWVHWVKMNKIMSQKLKLIEQNLCMNNKMRNTGSDEPLVSSDIHIILLKYVNLNMEDI